MELAEIEAAAGKDARQLPAVAAAAGASPTTLAGVKAAVTVGARVEVGAHEALNSVGATNGIPDEWLDQLHGGSPPPPTYSPRCMQSPIHMY